MTPELAAMLSAVNYTAWSDWCLKSHRILLLIRQFLATATTSCPALSGLLNKDVDDNLSTRLIRSIPAGLHEAHWQRHPKMRRAHLRNAIRAEKAHHVSEFVSNAIPQLGDDFVCNYVIREFETGGLGNRKVEALWRERLLRGVSLLDPLAKSADHTV